MSVLRATEMTKMCLQTARRGLYEAATAPGVYWGTAQLFFPQALGSSFDTCCPPYRLWGKYTPFVHANTVIFDTGGEETSISMAE